MNLQVNGEKSQDESKRQRNLHILELPAETLDAIFAHVRKCCLLPKCDSGSRFRLVIPNSSISASCPKHSESLRSPNFIDNSVTPSMTLKIELGMSSSTAWLRFSKHWSPVTITMRNILKRYLWTRHMREIQVRGHAGNIAMSTAVGSFLTLCSLLH